MKKNVLGLLAVAAAVSLSAFTTKNSTTTDLFYWFDHGGTYVGSSSSPDDNPLGCTAIGDNCVKGYQRPTQPAVQPATTPDAEQALDQ